MTLSKFFGTSLLLGAIFGIVGCASEKIEVLNPFGEEAPPDAGERSNKLLLEESGGAQSKGDEARHALEVMNSYRQAQAPQPVYPVVQPAEVRLMWVPDHLNKAGDLVPAHYYYLRVLNDRWAVQDAFDLERQLSTGSTSDASSVPYVLKEVKKRGKK